MTRPTLIFLMLFSSFFLQDVLGRNCTEDEAESATTYLQHIMSKDPKGKNCVDIEDFTPRCNEICRDSKEYVYNHVEDCAVDTDFGYMNIIKLIEASNDICDMSLTPELAASIKTLDESKLEKIFPDTNESLSAGSSSESSAGASSASSSEGGSEGSSDSDGGDGNDESDTAWTNDDGWDIPSTASNSSHDRSSGPKLYAIVLPIVIALFLAATAVCWWKRRRKSASATKNEEQEDAYTQDGAHTRTETVTQDLPSTQSNVYDIWSDRELIDKKLNFAEIQDVKILGSGAFGVVWLVSYYQNYYAAKRLARNALDTEAFDKFVDEVKLVARIEHANIIDCIGVAWTMKSDFQALFEYMANGDLRDYLQRPDVPRHWTKEKLYIAIDIAEALVYVQSFDRPIVHRDLKSRNVLLSEDMVAKVSDFGSARLMSDSNTMTTQAVGTARWLAPEVVAGESYDHTCDSYSFGAILTELDTHELPLHDATDAQGQKLPDFALMHRVASRMIKPSVSEGCPQVMRELVDNCLNFDAKERPTAVQISFLLRKMLKDGSVLGG